MYLCEFDLHANFRTRSIYSSGSREDLNVNDAVSRLGFILNVLLA